MNVNQLKTLFDHKAGRTSLYLQKHSPEILLGAGLIGVVATIYLASRATLKAQEVMEGHNLEMELVDREVEQPNNDVNAEKGVKEKAQIYVQTGFKLAKLYGPAVGVGVLSLTAILSSHGVMVRRQTSLVAAYGLLAKGYDAYRQRVREEFGEEKDRQFHLGLRETEKTVSEEGEDGKKRKVKTTVLTPIEAGMPSVYARVFDNSNPNFRSDRLLNAAFLTAQERYANDVLLIRGWLSLNEVYDRLGFPATPEGQLVGWVLRNPEEMKKEKRDGYVSFDLDGGPANREFMRGENDAIFLDFNVDGVMYHLIER